MYYCPKSYKQREGPGISFRVVEEDSISASIFAQISFLRVAHYPVGGLQPEQNTPIWPYGIVDPPRFGEFKSADVAKTIFQGGLNASHLRTYFLEYPRRGCQVVSGGN